MKTSLLAPFALAVCLAVAAPALAQRGMDMPDGPITRSQVIDAVKTQFAAIDANHDGVVTQAEFQAYHDRAGDQPQGGGPFGRVGGRWFERADAKGDGQVTLEEAEARPLHFFDMADSNHDGVISPKERQTAMMMMSLGHKGHREE